MRDVSGTLPAELTEETTFSEFKVSEHLRTEHRLLGRVAEFEVDPRELMVVFKAPGYSADIFIERETGNYSLMESRSGIVAVMNDLHKGRDSGAGWSWVIDISAGVMMLVSLSGFGLLFYLKKRRVSGVVAAVLGTVLFAAGWLLLVP